MRLAWTGSDWSIWQNLNIPDVFWTNQVQMRQWVVGRCRVGGGLQVQLDLWLMIGLCSLSMLGSCIIVPALMYDSETII